ncbi:MAG: hypothetical protein Ct9H300mP19_05030 [Dehalococcoidia bacterium]|nr:MAG: hypothetical protein Ct9H300mP19_05030 [Dehalococcoidia bacterium]
MALPAALIFGFFFIAFAVKLPCGQCIVGCQMLTLMLPGPVSVMLAGVLLKMAGYGLLRINLGFFQETRISRFMM